MLFYFESILKILCIVIPLLLSVALFTVSERKLIGSIQRRRGPNVVGVFGLIQAFGDGLKLLLKETILPSSSNKKLFIFAPILTFFLSLVSWAVVPINEAVVFADLNVGILFLLAVSGMGVYGVIIAGWSSNSKYAFLGALRSAAQIISYEIALGFIIVNVILCAGSLNLTQVVIAQEKIWYIFPLFPMFILFFISCLAETNRHPFDLPEAEAELVSGYNVEYSAIGFALFFLGEYANIILISLLTVLFFFGGWLFPISFFSGAFCIGFKTFFFIGLFIWSRAAFPRYRYDQLIRLGWKVFLPLSIGYVVFTSSFFIGLDILSLLKIIKMLIEIGYFIYMSSLLFILGIFGLIMNRRSVIVVLISVEIILLAVNLNFIFYSVFIDDIVGQLFAFFILTVAAAESSIGLAILVAYFRINSSLEIKTLLQGLIRGM